MSMAAFYSAAATVAALVVVAAPQLNLQLCSLTDRKYGHLPGGHLAEQHCPNSSRIHIRSERECLGEYSLEDASDKEESE